MIHVVLCDDHAVLRRGIRDTLAEAPDIQVTGEAGGYSELREVLRTAACDVLLLDLNMPGLSGLEVLQILFQDQPESAVIVLTVSEEGDELAEALRRGARGYLVKNIDAEALVSSIRRVVAGEPIIDPGMTAKLVAHFRNEQPSARAQPTRNALTAREIQVARLLAKGASNKVVARELDVAESTVKIHVQNVLKKLNLNSRVQIAVYVVEHGLPDDA